MKKDKVKNNNKKGFTLIEVLAVIVIIGIISSIAFAVYFNVIDKSKTSSVDLSMNNIKSAAELYVKESFDSVKWNKSEGNEYACVTISDLINAGYFKEDFYNDSLYEDSNISSDTYVSIIRNSDNKADFEISILSDEDDEDTLAMCKTVADTDSGFRLISNLTYTDSIDYKFSSLKNGMKYVYLWKKNGESDWQEINSNSNKLFQDELIKSGDEYDYDLKVCLYNEEDATLNNCKEETDNKKYYIEKVKLEDFEAPKIEFDPDSTITLSAYREVTITYSNKNIYNNEGYHYFTSDMDGVLDSGQDVYLCDGASFSEATNCITKASSIQSGIIYYTPSKEVSYRITQNIFDNSKKVHAYIKDKTNNFKEVDKEIPKIDVSLPQCEIVLIGTKGDNGYYKSDVEVKLETGEKDDFSTTTYGLVAGGSNYKPTNSILTLTQSSNTAGVTYYGYAKYSKNDGSTAESTCKKTLKIDKSAPTCAVTMEKSKKEDMSSPSSYDGSWYKGYAKTKPTCTDTGGSGCSGSFKVVVDASKSNASAGTFAGITTRGVTGQGATKHTWIISDKAGNSTTCGAVTIKLDRTGPKCDDSKSNTNSTGGVTVKFSCKDRPTDVSSSGVASCTGKKTGLKSGNSYSIKDNVGNTGKCEVKVSKKKQYRYRTRSHYCKSCSKAGCKTYKTCKTSACGTEKYTCTKKCAGYIYTGNYSSGGKCVARTVKCGSGTQCKSCEYSCKKTCTRNKTCANKACGCKTYKANCSKCGNGYGSWGSWSSWSTNPCSSSATKQCDSRTVYY